MTVLRDEMALAFEPCRGIDLPSLLAGSLGAPWELRYPPVAIIGRCPPWWKSSLVGVASAGRKDGNVNVLLTLRRGGLAQKAAPVCSIVTFLGVIL